MSPAWLLVLVTPWGPGKVAEFGIWAKPAASLLTLNGAKSRVLGFSNTRCAGPWGGQVLLARPHFLPSRRQWLSPVGDNPLHDVLGTSSL